MRLVEARDGDRDRDIQIQRLRQRLRQRQRQANTTTLRQRHIKTLLAVKWIEKQRPRWLMNKA